MISFKAHSTLKQYIKSKPHKWGLKVFARAEFGDIVYEFEIYVGKGTTEETELGISWDIVIKLCEHLPKQRNVYGQFLYARRLTESFEKYGTSGCGYSSSK
jgi:hypothetical protein